MVHPLPIDDLLGLCAEPHSSLVLIAPFVKAGVLSQVLEVVPEAVDLRVVTRWELQEIAAGVSDLEVWPMLRDRPRSELRVRAALHAKAYLTESRALVGSANLTIAALAGPQSGNLELLLEVPRGHPQVAEMLSVAVSTSCRVDDAMYEAFQLLVEMLPTVATEADAPSWGVESPWFPTFRVPGDLQSAAVAGIGFTDDQVQCARRELAMLRVPLAVAPSGFVLAVGTAMRAQPLVVALDQFLSGGPRRFGELRQWVGAITGTQEERDSRTQTLIRWVSVFLPADFEYRRSRHSEILVRAGAERG